jgi:5-methylcytosine-specific restriction endonuclease McrA
MSDILNSNSVLRLNDLHQRIGWSSVRDAFTAMMGGRDGSVPYMALDIEYAQDADGNYLLNEMIGLRRVDWEEWITLPVRQGLDQSINGTRQKIRVPTVVVCPNFQIMPKKEQRPTPAAIKRRDGNVCQYTGVPLTNKTFSLDHIVPKSKGGKDSWQNMVAAHKDVNSKKGNKWNHEAGLKLKKQPLAPKMTPLCVIYNEIKHPDHNHF